ncbi:hypothetical protein B0H16DRAFT_146430 [Mycena metata]|uniref:Uncharacterized protein n=1 Tax=Mycena metata TaxID=1033252 RepID=A0AAD7JYX9_9AGAR|nr:hypothetical protein B0H16DRAFT_146430 [Mycena metata]
MAGNHTMSNLFAGEDISAERQSFTLLAIFNFLEIFGFLSLAIIVLTAWLSPMVRRTSAWYSFMLSWMFFCLSYFLIAGQQVGAEPSFEICVTQAALIYAAPVLTSCVSLAFLLQLHSTASSVLRSGSVSRIRTTTIQIFPFTVHFIVFIETLTLGLSNRPEVARDISGMFCHLTNSLQAKLTATVVILAMLTMLVYEGLTVALLYRNWTAFKRLRVRSNDAILLPLMIRVTVFSFLPMVAMMISSLAFLPSSPIAEGKLHIIVAFLPAAAAIIFGTQHDILNAWMFWNRKKTAVPEHKKINIQVAVKVEDSPV